MQTLTELFGVRKESFKDSVRKLSKTDIAGLENLSKQTVDDIFYGTGDYMKQLSVMEQVGIPAAQMTIYELAYRCIRKLLPDS